MKKICARFYSILSAAVVLLLLNKIYNLQSVSRQMNEIFYFTYEMVFQ